MRCAKCKEELSGGDYVVCSLCSVNFHYNCSVREARWRVMTAEQKAKWTCGNCKDSSQSQGSGKNSVGSNPSEEVKEDVSVKELLLTMNSRLDKLDDVKKTVDGITTSIGFLSEKYDELLQEVREYKEANKELCKTIDELKSSCARKDEELATLTRRFNSLEQYGRGLNLEIHGLSDENKGYENSELILQQTAKAIGVTYNSAEIQAAHRVPSRNRDSKHPEVFLVQFVSKATKEKWLRMGRKSRVVSRGIVGSGENRVFFNENLTPFYKNLLWETKNLAREKRYEFVWVLHGHIKVKKSKESRETLTITDYQDLARIK